MSAESITKLFSASDRGEFQVGVVRKRRIATNKQYNFRHA